MCAHTPDSQSSVKENILHIFKQRKNLSCVKKTTVLINVEFLGCSDSTEKLAEELYSLSASSFGHHKNRNLVEM